METRSLHPGKIRFIAAILIAGTVMNYLSARVTDAFSLPAGIAFIIAAYCLIVMVLPLRLSEVAGIGVVAGVLTILSDPRHLTTILSGQAATAAGLMAFFNLVSEPVGIVACLWAYTFLKGKARAGVPFVAAFLATGASGLAYLLLVLVFNPLLTVAQPGYADTFLPMMTETAILTALIVQLVYLARGLFLPSGLKANSS